MVLGIIFLHEVFENFIVTEVNRVPELRLAVMEVINAVKIEILFVPSEHGLPASHVNIWVSNTWNFLVSKTIATTKNKVNFVY